MWATTADRPQAHEEFLSWLALWEKYGMTLYRQVTGDPKYDLAVFSTHVIELEDAFKRQALRNLRRRPSVYLHNVVNNLWRFCSDSMASWPITFADQNQLPLSRHGSSSALQPWLAAVGPSRLLRGLWRRDASAWTLFLVSCSLATAHAITFLYPRYTYVKLPLLSMALTLTLAALEGRSLAPGRTRVRLRLSALLAVTVLLCSVSATMLLLAR